MKEANKLPELPRLPKGQGTLIYTHGNKILYQVVDLVLGGAGQQLHDEAACAAHAQVLIYQYAQGADRGNLFAICWSWRWKVFSRIFSTATT